jgi:transcription elongation factor GreA
MVGAAEADPIHGKISNESPIGKALLNKKEGEKVQVETPAGILVIKVVKLN